MKSRINPPSSMHRHTLENLRQHCQSGEVWSTGSPPIACVLFTYKPDALYVGKMGFVKTYEGRHEGFNGVTFIGMQKRVV